MQVTASRALRGDISAYGEGRMMERICGRDHDRTRSSSVGLGLSVVVVGGEGKKGDMKERRSEVREERVVDVRWWGW